MGLAVGDIVEGKVSGITKFGAFVDLPDDKTGMVHISEIAQTYVKEISDFVKMGQVVKVKVMSISPEGKIGLSIKKALPPAPKPNSVFKKQSSTQSPGRPGSFEWQSSKRPESTSFEDMMSRFKQTSDEKMSDLKRFNEGSSRRSGRGSRGNGNNGYQSR